MFKPSAWLTAKAILAAVVMAACGVFCAPAPASSATPAGPKGDIVVLLAGEAGTLDWHMHADLNAHEIDRQIFDTLLRRDYKTLEIKSHLAESYRLVNDTTWEFKLRRGIKFHNGEPFNAEAVKFSLERIINPDQKAPGRANIKLIDHVDIINEYTVRVITSAPFPLLPVRMVSGQSGCVAILPPKYIKEKGDAFFGTHPVGTGPYKFVEWKKDEYVKLEANLDYFVGVPPFKTITFKPVPEPATRVAALLAGQADIIMNISVEDFDKIEKSGVATVKPSPLGNWMINLMVTNYVMKGPWTDKRVRQALNHAVDMNTITKSLYAGRAKVVGYSLEPEAFGFNPNIKWYPYDPEKAKKLLVEAGYPNGFSMTLHVPNHRYPNDVEMAQAVASYWEKVGVKTEVKVWEQSVYVTKWRAKELEPAFVVAWGGAGLLDGDLLTNAYHTEASLSIFSNQNLDDLLNKAAATMDPAKRKELYWKAQELIHDEAPSVQSFQLQTLMGVSKRLEWEPWISYEVFFILEDYKAVLK